MKAGYEKETGWFFLTQSVSFFAICKNDIIQLIAGKIDFCTGKEVSKMLIYTTLLCALALITYMIQFQVYGNSNR